MLAGAHVWFVPTDCLHVVAGAAATGKSTVRRALADRVTAALFEGDDLLDVADPPSGVGEAGEREARAFNDVWLRVCASAAHSGRPVVLFGSGLLPRLVEPCDARDRFEQVRYLVLVCEEARLRQRLRDRPGAAIHDDYWGDVDRQVALNAEYRGLGDSADVPVETLDTTDRSVSETADAVAAWLSA